MDTALKQRLVGASVLIALAVVVLPMLLGGRPDNANPESQKIELPPQPEELDFETRRYPVGEQKKPPPREHPADSSKSLPSPNLRVESPPPGAPEPDAVPVEPILSPIVPVATPSTDHGRYIVQVASFGAVDNANRLSATLRSYGYDVLVDTVKSDVGTLHRVRVGPYASESDATGMVSKLQSQVAGIKPRVMDLQPEKAAQVTKPSDPLVRWIVQVGSFSNAANADKLVARLKLESLTAYKEQVSNSGNVIYRVRVGPFLEREEALGANTLIRDRMSIDGVVMSAD